MTFWTWTERQPAYGRPRRLVTFGRCPRDWKSALRRQSRLWHRFPGLDVRHAHNLLELFLLAWRRPSCVLPLWPKHIRKCPPWWPGLRPARRAVGLLDDKTAFARHLRALGLEHLIPRTYLVGETPAFPVVIKPACASNGRGVSFIASADALETALLASARSRAGLVVQEQIPGNEDFATYVVCRGGRILGHRTLRYRLGKDAIQRSETIVSRERTVADEAALGAFQQVLGSLAYDGPAAIDWRRRPDGAPVIFEINPRLGGGLMRPEFEDELAAMLELILANARPPRLFG